MSRIPIAAITLAPIRAESARKECATHSDRQADSAPMQCPRDPLRRVASERVALHLIAFSSSDVAS